MKKILIIKNDGIGDSVIATPFFNFFINQPNSEVDILCQKKSYSYLKNNFKFKNIITVNKDIYFTFPTLNNLSIKNKFINIYKYLFFRPTRKDKKIKIANRLD